MERTVPYWEKRLVRDSSVVLGGKLPINSVIKFIASIG